MKFLTFMLAGPLSSFGETERWDHRGTEDMPTKSAIVGLLGCCLGINRGSDRLERLDEKLNMAVRRDKRGALLTDYQTVQSPTGAILNTEGKPRGSTIVTPKQYLQEARFQVFLYGDEAMLLECEAAMRHPRWVTGLGRKCAVPSIPLRGRIIEGDSVIEVMRSWNDPDWVRLCQKKAAEARDKGRDSAERSWTNLQQDARMRCEMDFASMNDLSRIPGAYRTVRHDSVIRADENRYGDRQVVSLSVERGQALCI